MATHDPSRDRGNITVLGDPPPAVTGEWLLNEIFDLISEHLPNVSQDDPARTHLAALAPQLGAALGRPAISLTAAL